MQYVNLKKILSEGTSSSSNSITIPSDLFQGLLIIALRYKGVFDESFYLASNPDVKDAVARNIVVSAAEHYYTTGYFEGRIPKRLLVDERFYLERNPDVSAAIRKNAVASAQDHFDFAGFREGRQPYDGFTLF